MNMTLGMGEEAMRHIPHRMKTGENDDLEEQRLPTIQNLKLIMNGFELALEGTDLSAVGRNDLETYTTVFQQFLRHAESAKRFSGKDFNDATVAINAARLDLLTKYPSVAKELGIDNVV